MSGRLLSVLCVFLFVPLWRARSKPARPRWMNWLARESHRTNNCSLFESELQKRRDLRSRLASGQPLF